MAAPIVLPEEWSIGKEVTQKEFDKMRDTIDQIVEHFPFQHEIYKIELFSEEEYRDLIGETNLVEFRDTVKGRMVPRGTEIFDRENPETTQVIMTEDNEKSANLAHELTHDFIDYNRKVEDELAIGHKLVQRNDWVEDTFNEFLAYLTEFTFSDHVVDPHLNNPFWSNTEGFQEIQDLRDEIPRQIEEATAAIDQAVEKIESGEYDLENLYSSLNSVKLPDFKLPGDHFPSTLNNVNMSVMRLQEPLEYVHEGTVDEYRAGHEYEALNELVEQDLEDIDELVKDDDLDCFYKVENNNLVVSPDFQEKLVEKRNIKELEQEKGQLEDYKQRFEEEGYNIFWKKLWENSSGLENGRGRSFLDNLISLSHSVGYQLADVLEGDVEPREAVRNPEAFLDLCEDALEMAYIQGVNLDYDLEDAEYLEHVVMDSVDEYQDSLEKAAEYHLPVYSSEDPEQTKIQDFLIHNRFNSIFDALKNS